MLRLGRDARSMVEKTKAKIKTKIKASNIMSTLPPPPPSRGIKSKNSNHTVPLSPVDTLRYHPTTQKTAPGDKKKAERDVIIPRPGGFLLKSC